MKHQRSASLGFVRGTHRWPVNSPHKGPVTRKMFPFGDVVMLGDAVVYWNSSFQTYIKDRCFEHFLWNCTQANITRPHWCPVNIGPGNGSMPSGNKPSPEPMLTWAICRHFASLGHNYLILERPCPLLCITQSAIFKYLFTLRKWTTIKNA